MLVFVPEAPDAGCPLAMFVGVLVLVLMLVPVLAVEVAVVEVAAVESSTEVRIETYQV